MTLRIKEIENVPLLSGLAEPQLKEVLSIARTKEVKRREVIFRQGEPVEGFFVLVSGSVKIYKLSANGREHILHIVKSGQPFAEAAVFMPGGYPAFAEALLKSKVLFFPKDEFIKLISMDPSISLQMIATLSHYLKQFSDRIEDLSLMDVSARLARWALKTSAETGRDFWELEITKGALASQLGTVNETLSRTLRKFMDSECLEVRGKFMKILDRDALQSIADGEGGSM